MYIKILAKTSDAKGTLFEQLMGNVLDGFGYTDLKFDQMMKSGEIDITGYHKISNQEILVECKTHDKPIKRIELQKFHSKYKLEFDNRSKEKKLPLLGLFFSLSGFANPASKYHEQMNEEQKALFQIFGYKEIADILKDSKLICNEETIRNMVERILPYAISRCYLVKSESGLFWVIILSTESEETHYAIVDGKGNIAINREQEGVFAIRKVYDEISRLDKELKDKNMINLQAHKKVTLCLLDCESKTKEAIAEAINESITDVKLELDRLAKENICDIEILGEVKSHKLRKDILTFARLTKKFLSPEEEDRGKFANSEYYFTMIDPGLAKYVANRFRLPIIDDELVNLRRLLLFSPSALMYSLYNKTEDFDQSYSDIQKLNLSDSDRVRFNEIRFSKFWTNLIRKFLDDIEDVEYGFLHHRTGVKLIKLLINLKMATPFEKYMEVNSGGTFALAQAVGNIKGGQLVSYQHPADAFRVDGLALHHLGEFQEAIESYDTALSLTQSSDVKVAILNNKGLAYWGLGNYEKAVSCYDEAIKLNSEQKEAWTNKGKCLVNLGRYSEAIECAKKALEIDSSWQVAKSFLAEIEIIMQNLSKNP
jgi:tetratricopeptide (TPR) repeat protein